MFGRYLRGIVYLLVSPLVGGFLQLVLGEIIDFMNPPEDSKLAEVFIQTQQHFTLLVILSVASYLLVGAVIERGVTAR